MAGASVMLIDKVSASIKNYRNDLNKSYEIIKAVNDDYDTFVEKAKEVKENIIVVSKSFNFYLDKFLKKNKDLVAKINKVEETINELDDISYRIINNCKYDLNNSSMEAKCKSFYNNYPNMIDSYNKMLEEYNSVIKRYNTYASKVKKKKVALYEYNLTNSEKIIEAIK